jgi:hypothetical protein
MLERARNQFLALPLLVHAGLVVLVLGGLVDGAAHLVATDQTDHVDGHTAFELSAHLVVFVGMVVILLGVVVDGIRRTLRRLAEPVE